MLIILGSLLLIGLGIFLIKKNGYFSSGRSWGEASIFVGGIILLCCLAHLSATHISVPNILIDYSQLRDNLSRHRNDSTIVDVERSTVFNKVLEMNSNIQKCRYWNETIFDIFIPDTLTKLELLK